MILLVSTKAPLARSTPEVRDLPTHCQIWQIWALCACSQISSPESCQRCWPKREWLTFKIMNTFYFRSFNSVGKIMKIIVSFRLITNIHYRILSYLSSEWKSWANRGMIHSYKSSLYSGRHVSHGDHQIPIVKPFGQDSSWMGHDRKAVLSQLDSMHQGRQPKYS